MKSFSLDVQKNCTKHIKIVDKGSTTIVRLQLDI